MSQTADTTRRSDATRGELLYDMLAEAGVGPTSSMKEIRTAKRYFTRRRRITEVHHAFTTLQVVEGRLLTDFFLYRQPEA